MTKLAQVDHGAMPAQLKSARHIIELSPQTRATNHHRRAIDRMGHTKRSE